MRQTKLHGCRVTVTGDREERVLKLIRTLIPKPVKAWKVTAVIHGRERSLSLEYAGLTRRKAVADAKRVWHATLPCDKTAIRITGVETL